MTINGNANEPIQAMAQAIANVLGKCCAPRDDDEDSETVEVKSDVLVYRKTRTVTEVEVEVSMEALTTSGVTLIEALAAALRGPEKPKDPIAELARAASLLGKMRRNSCEQCQNPMLKGLHTCGVDRMEQIDPLEEAEIMEASQRAADAQYNERLAKERAKERTELLDRVFGNAHVDQSAVKIAVDQIVQRLERDGPDGRKILDKDGLNDMAAQLVVMIPDDRWAAMSAARLEPNSPLGTKAYDVPCTIAGLVAAFIPERHRPQAIEALVHAAHSRSIGTQRTTPSASKQAPETPPST